jgi:3-oxoacyl-[acyl-carrier protein] reductase
VEWELANYDHFSLNVTEELQVRNMIRHVQKKYGRLDVLINNAGIASMNHSLLTPLSTARNIMETNFLGTFLMCCEGARLMRKNKYGRIVNIGSVAVPMRIEGEALYAASKSAIVTFTQIIAKELASFNITCNVVAPAPIETDLIRSVPAEKINKIIQNLTIKRLCKFEDVANVIDFFVRRESSYITAQIIYLGGV